MNSKYKLIIAVAIICAIIAGSVIMVNNSHKAVFSQDDTMIQPFTDKCGDITISADPRLELLASVELNSGFYNIVQYDTEYKNDMKNHFKALKNHKVVRLFKELSKKGIYIDIPPKMMLHLSEVPDLHVKAEIDEDTIKLFTKDIDTTNQFIQELQDYAKSSGIQTFFKAHEDFFRSNIQKVKSILMRNDYVKDIEGYYGLKQDSYNVILSPLYEGNYGIRIKNDNGYDLYAIIGGCDIKENVDEDMLRYLIWHEFSHSFVNPLSEEPSNQQHLTGYEDNFQAIKENMSKQGYSSWINSINEHIIRAVTIRLTYIKYGAEMANKLLKEERDKGFIYIDELCNKLESYENNRNQYKNFIDFYPELMAVFEKKY